VLALVSRKLRSMNVRRVLVLGSGYTGSRALRAARAQGVQALGSVRSVESAAPLLAEGFTIFVGAAGAGLEDQIAPFVDAQTHVVVAFPPDGQSDERLAPHLAGAHSIAYISSTGVYGETRGRIDAETPLPASPDARAQRILRAEQAYRSVGGAVLRSPGIYGPDRGLHVRVLSGEHKIPGDGSRTLSRIHAEDLAAFALALHGVPGRTFVVGDLAPAPHIEVVRFICERYGAPLPPFVPLDSVHASLRADRAIDASQALRELGVTLRFPSYREGMDPAVTGLRAG
jgi:nucleoside-diphosphate-sugar epimerase